MNKVRVIMDGKPLYVPERVNSWMALRGALGVRRGMGVAVKSLYDKLDRDDALNVDVAELSEGWAVLGGCEDVPGEVVRYWEFSEGEEYRSVGIEDTLEALFDSDDDREPWQSDPDGWKRG